MDSQSRSHFVIQLFGPLLRPKGASLILAASVAASGLLTWLELSVTARLQRNSTLVSLLALEVSRESSADLHAARQTQARLIKEMLGRMEDPAVKIVGKLRPKYSPEVQLTPAIDALLGVGGTNLADADALARAANVLEKAGQLWFRGDQADSVSIWAHGSDTRVKIADEFFQSFRRSASEFRKDPTISHAEKACMDSRIATAMFVSSWTSYEQQRRKVISKQFAAELAALRESMQKAATCLSADEARRVQLYADNVGKRADLLTSLDSGGIPAAHKQLAVELARR